MILVFEKPQKCDPPLVRNYCIDGDIFILMRDASHPMTSRRMYLEANAYFVHLHNTETKSKSTLYSSLEVWS